MKISTLSLVFCTICCCLADADVNSVPQNLGYATVFATLPATPHIATKLGLSLEERKEITRSGLQLYKNDSFRDVRRMLARWKNVELEEYFNDGLQKNRESALEFNKELLAKAGEFLSGSEKRLMKRLLNQQLIRLGYIDSLLVMNDVTISFEVYESLVLDVEKYRSLMPSESAERYQASLAGLSGFVDKKVLSAAVGSEYKKDLVNTKRRSPISIRNTENLLLKNPEVQIELGLTLQQLSRLKSLQGELRGALQSANEERRVAVASGDKGLFESSDKSVQKKVAVSIGDALNEQQQTRLNQLVVQSLVRSMDWSGAIRRADISDADLPSDVRSHRNWIQAEASYARQINSVNATAKALDENLGEGTTNRLCGKFEITFSGWRHIDEKLDKQALNRVKNRTELGVFAEPSRSNNPRRSH